MILTKTFAHVPVTLLSVVLEVLVPKGRMLPTRRHNGDFIELEVKIVTKPLFVPRASESTGKEGSPVLAGFIDLDSQGEIGLLLHSGAKEYYVWNTGDPLGHLLVLS